MSEESDLKLAHDVVKQTITLATGVISLSLTFRSQLTSEGGWEVLLEASWFLMACSVVAGLIFQLSYVGILSDGQPSTTVSSWKVRGPWLVQLGLFLTGLFTFVAFGFLRF